MRILLKGAELHTPTQRADSVGALEHILGLPPVILIRQKGERIQAPQKSSTQMAIYLSFWKRLKGKNQTLRTSENFSEESNLPQRFEDIQKYFKSSKSDIFYLLRNLLKYLLRTFFFREKFSQKFLPFAF